MSLSRILLRLLPWIFIVFAAAFFWKNCRGALTPTEPKVAVTHHTILTKVEELIIKLCAENMIDEERYAQSYVRGKYGIKKWGRRKIIQGLKGKRISDYCIKKGMQEIDGDLYYENLKSLLEKKERTEKEKNPFARKQKISLFLQSKGYENDLIQDLLKENS